MIHKLLIIYRHFLNRDQYAAFKLSHLRCYLWIYVQKSYEFLFTDKGRVFEYPLVTGLLSEIIMISGWVTLDCIILAGGLGTRISEIAKGKPKTLLLVCGHPFIDLLLAQVTSFQSVKRLILALGVGSELVRVHVEKKQIATYEVKFSMESKPLGTGGALLKALPFVESEIFLLMNGDSFIDINWADFYQSFQTQQQQTCGAMVVRNCEAGIACGIVNVKENSNHITDISRTESASSNMLMNAGIYMFNTKKFKQAIGNSAPTDKQISFESELLPQIINNKLFAHKSNGVFADIGTPDTFARAQVVLQEASQRLL